MKQRLLFSYRFWSVAICLCALGAPVFVRAEPAPLYRVEKTVPLDGAVKWDYLAVDSDRHRLFITRGASVDVLDTATDKLIASIAGLKGVHGVALAPEFGRGYISDGAANEVIVFDLTDYKIITRIAVGNKPDAIVYDSVSKRVFAANGRDGTLSVIDAAGDKSIGAIDLGGKPEFAVTDGAGQLFINLEDKAQMLAIDTASLAIKARWALDPVCDEPSGLAIDSVKQRLFAGCSNEVMAIVDARSGKIIAHPPIGESSDAIAFDPGTGLVFSSNGEGTLTIIRADGPDLYAVAQTLPTMESARTMAVDPASHAVYLSAATIAGYEEPTEDNPDPRPSMKPGSFVIVKAAAAGGRL